jgi:transposase-like protein
VYRAVDQYGQIFVVYVSSRRDIGAARRFFVTVVGDHGEPTEVVTDRAPALLAVVDELMPGAFHYTPPSTRTTGSKPITVDSKRASARCAASNATTLRAGSCAVMR